MEMRGEHTHAYAAAVVLNLKQFHPAIFDGNTNGRSTSIQAVFKQFL